MKKLIHQVSKKQLKNALIQIVLLGMCACTGNNLPSDNNQSIDRQLLIDTTGVIPVINGKPTNSGVYIHNLSNVAISNISYHVLNTSNDYKLNLDDEKNCSEVAAGASCLIKFTTSELNPGNSASALLIAKYDNKQSKQLINYQYIDSHNYHGISFTNPLIHIDRSHPYATTYAFNPQTTQSDTDSIELDNDSIQLVNGAKNNTLNIEANQVLPIEFKLADIIKDKQTSIYLANNKDQPIMRVLVSPENKANILFSNPEVLELKKTDTAKITLYNNGSTAATNLHLDVDNANKLIIQPSGENDCINGGSLAAGASCNYQVMVIDKNKTDIRSLFFSYNDGIDEINETLNLAYISEDKAPSLRIAAETSRLYIDGGTSSKVKFILNNIGDIPFENMDIRLHSSLALSTITEDAAKSNCGKSLDAGSSCQITAEINAANYRNESGTIYLTADGDTSSKDRRSYKFASLPLKVEVSDKTQLALTDFRPLDKALNVRTNTGIELMFNKPVNMATIDSPNVYIESAGGVITLHPGAIIDDTHVSLLPDASLSENTLYRIVINQLAITDLNGKSLGVNSRYIAGSFTTGDFTAPEIIDFAPKNGEQGVSITNPNIFLQFSEAMDVSTINADSIYLESNTTKAKFTNVKLIVESAESRVQMVLTGSSTLASLTNYNLIVDETRLKDKAGNPVGSNAKLVVSNFTSLDITPKLISIETVVEGGCVKGTGTSESPCYSSPTYMGGSNNMRVTFWIKNISNPYKAITGMQIAMASQEQLFAQGFKLAFQDCEGKTISSDAPCRYIYHLPSPSPTSATSKTMSDKLTISLFNGQKSETYSIDYDLRIVEPKLSVPDFKFQIMRATNTWFTLVMDDFYTFNFSSSNININRSVKQIVCDTYDGINSRQVCRVNLANTNSPGIYSLVIKAWVDTIRYTQNFEVGRVIYVTKGQWTGNLGGITGANQKCQSEAPAGTTAKALLEMARPTVAGQRYFNIYGDFLGVALQDNAFRVGQTLESAIDVNNTARDNKVWFGSTSGDLDCSDWTVGGTQWGAEADPSLSSSSWQYSGRAQCGLTNRLYCVTQ